MSARSERWGLEVVRGRDAGRRYVLSGAEVVLGNAPGDPSAIDLSDQEGDSPRRMAARQAVVEGRNGTLAIRDLDSPGGTFVNRRRVLPGQSQPLSAGDVLQLGSVQLRVVAATGPADTPPIRPAPKATPKAPPARPAPAVSRASAPTATPLAFTLRAGPTCRSWDDFLAVAAQRWADLRDELASGRLAAYLAAHGHAAHAPRADAPGTPDERLDDWLGTLPTTRRARPELDVYPRSVDLRVTPGGGRTRRSVRVANVGHRLLRSTARVEPPGTPWLALAPEFARGPFVTIEETEVPFLVTIPEVITGPLSAALVIEGNGGSVRVAVTLDRAKGPDAIPDATAAVVEGPGLGLRERIERQPLGLRFVGWPVAAVALRLVIGLAGLLAGMVGLGAGGAGPALAGVAMAFAALGGLAGAIQAGRRGSALDVVPGACAGGFAGVLLAAVGVAVCRAIEPATGSSWTITLLVGLAVWAALGTLLAGLSAWLVPPRPAEEPAP